MSLQGVGSDGSALDLSGKSLLNAEEAAAYLRAKCREEGSQLAFSEHHSVNPVSISDTLRGRTLLPPKLAKILNLEKVVMYRVLESPGE